MSEMQYKVAAFDLDGTLLNSKKTINASTYEAIKELREKGVSVVLASGRHPRGIIPVAEDLNLIGTDSYLLGFNGGATVDLRDMRRVVDYRMNAGLAWQIADAALELGLSPLTYTEDELLTLDMRNQYVQHEAKLSNLPMRQIPSFREGVTFKVHKVLVVGDPEIIKNGGEKILREKLASHCDVSRSAPFFLEVMPKGVDKGTGLETFLKLKNLGPQNLVAFGDGTNDQPMLDYAGIGVVMENGAEELKENADFITHSNDEDGIAYAVHSIWK